MVVESSQIVDKLLERRNKNVKSTSQDEKKKRFNSFRSFFGIVFLTIGIAAQGCGNTTLAPQPSEEEDVKIVRKDSGRIKDIFNRDSQEDAEVVEEKDGFDGEMLDGGVELEDGTLSDKMITDSGMSDSDVPDEISDSIEETGNDTNPLDIGYGDIVPADIMVDANTADVCIPGEQDVVETINAVAADPRGNHNITFEEKYHQKTDCNQTFIKQLVESDVRFEPPVDDSKDTTDLVAARQVRFDWLGKKMELQRILSSKVRMVAVLADATLAVGETQTVEGMKITVISAGVDSAMLEVNGVQNQLSIGDLYGQSGQKLVKLEKIDTSKNVTVAIMEPEIFTFKPGSTIYNEAQLQDIWIDGSTWNVPVLNIMAGADLRSLMEIKVMRNP